MPVKVIKTNNGIKFSICVVPKSSKNLLSVMEDGIIKLKINASPIEGKANEACVKYIADILGIAKSKVKIISGFKSKTKLIEIDGDSEVLYNRIIEIIKS